MTYERKIEFALSLLRSIPQDGTTELSYSGGKDSDVILELARMAGIPFTAVYKQTSIDPPGTTLHARENGVTIVPPVETFFSLVERKGQPSRFRRFCCSVLKEYKIPGHDRVILGIRRSESTRRAARYKEPEECRVYDKGGKVRQYYPILEWTDADVERFIRERGIRCAPVYYDESGAFHVERRLGCIGCPLRSDNGLADFRKYPRFLRRYIAAYQKYLDTHKGTKFWNDIQGSAYNGVFYRLFCRTHDEFISYIGGGYIWC